MRMRGYPVGRSPARGVVRHARGTGMTRHERAAADGHTYRMCGMEELAGDR